MNQQGDELKSRLRAYSIILIDQLNWEIRDQYLELVNEFVDKKFDSFKFRRTFEKRYESIEEVADVLKSNRVLLSPNQNSLDFEDLLSEIDNCCKEYCDDPQPYRDKFEIGEVEFCDLIEKISLKMQKFLNQ